jgi:hypothetical protein
MEQIMKTQAPSQVKEAIAEVWSQTQRSEPPTSQQTINPIHIHINQ